MKYRDNCYETRHRAAEVLDTHRHRRAYAALVVDGAYEEVSPDGSIQCVPGTIVLHPVFHAHGNCFGYRGARVMNVLMPDRWGIDSTHVWHTADLRAALEVFKYTPEFLPELLATTEVEQPKLLPAWQEAYLTALRSSDEAITALAARIGVSAAHASRAVFKSHGMSPQRLRLEWRWRRAMSLLAGHQSLVDIAMEAGFADQSHLTRTIRACTGLSPTALLNKIKCVQDGTPDQ
jgi:AraC family transcriptional regulator